MAITRSQQAKQLLALGGRIGLQGGGRDASSDDFGGGNTGGGNTGGGNGDKGSSNRERGIMSRGKGPKGTTGNIGDFTDTGPDRTAVGPESKFAKNRARQNIDRMRTGLMNVITPSTQPRNRAIRTILNITTPGLGEFFAKTIDRTQPDIFGTTIDDDDDDNKGNGIIPIIPPVDTTFAQAPLTMEPEPETEEENFERFRRFRAEGGIMNSNVVGGEFDFESARQMYGLGKLVKKVTKTVKKIAKSPIGKAAILGAVGFGIPGTSIGGLFGRASFMTPGGAGVKGLFGTKGIGAFFGKGSLNPLKRVVGVDKDVASSAFGELVGKIGPGTLITAASTLAGLMTPEQEEEAQELSRGEGIDIEAARRSVLARAQGNIRDDFRATRFRAEGGSTEEKEPVAKKVMPLIDMGGKEKDYRETGGFVDMGRMEKADDVPARLSKNEFVFTADAVRNAGDGSVDKGAEVMYNMMKTLEAGGEVSEESQGLEGARKMFQTSQRLEEVL